MVGGYHIIQDIMTGDQTKSALDAVEMESPAARRMAQKVVLHAVKKLRLTQPKMDNILYVPHSDTSKVNAQHRDVCAANLRCLTSFYGYHPRTLSFATHLLDQFVTKIKVPPKYVSCIATTCFYIAACALEAKEVVPRLQQLVLVSQCDCRVSDIQRMESIVRTKLSVASHLPPLPAQPHPQPAPSEEEGHSVSADGHSTSGDTNSHTSDDNDYNEDNDNDDDDESLMMQYALPATPASFMEAVLLVLRVRLSPAELSSMHSLLASVMCRADLLRVELPVLVLAIVQRSLLAGGHRVSAAAFAKVKLLTDAEVDDLTEALETVASFLSDGYDSPSHLPRQRLRWTLSQRTRNHLRPHYSHDAALFSIPETPYDCGEYSKSSEESITDIPECSTPDLQDFSRHFSMPSSPLELSPIHPGFAQAMLPSCAAAAGPVVSGAVDIQPAAPAHQRSLSCPPQPRGPSLLLKKACLKLTDEALAAAAEREQAREKLLAARRDGRSSSDGKIGSGARNGDKLQGSKRKRRGRAGSKGVAKGDKAPSTTKEDRVLLMEMCASVSSLGGEEDREEATACPAPAMVQCEP